MELIRISESKLKIMLTAEEVRLYAIPSGEVPRDARQAFGPVLERARQRCGFSASADRVFIQLFPSREGGCELFVTKLTEEPGDGAGGGTEPEEIYLFGRMAELVAACRSVAARGLGAGSRVYRAGGQYLLALSPSDARRARTEEFGEREPAALRFYIPEHADRLLPSGENDAAVFGAF